jgi:hypothetical protein
LFILIEKGNYSYSGYMDRMTRAAIDACSVIYLIKTGVFERLAAEISLITTRDVYGETGWPLKEGKPRLPLTLFPSPAASRSNDHGLFLLAKEKGCPLISEDREVLLMAEGEGMPYYNSLMMLIFLCRQGRVSREEYPLYRERLLAEAHYGESIVRRGDGFFDALFSSDTSSDRPDA